MKEKLYQGSSKTLYQSSEDFAFIMAFSDKLTLETGEILEISGKGVLNNNISAYLMTKLAMVGIDNHLIKKLNMREQLIQSVDIFPIQIAVSTVACGRFVKDFSIEEGYVFDRPIIDFRVRSSELKHPIINEHQIVNFGWLTSEEIRKIKHQALRTHDFLSGLFSSIGIRLVECVLEFGRVFNGEEFIIMLADEITPDNCRLWNMNNNEKLGIELISSDQEKALKSYQLIANLLKDKIL